MVNMEMRSAAAKPRVKAETVSNLCRQLPAMVLGVTLMTPAVAVEWDFRPRAEAGASYTNNVALVDDDAEESERVMELTPGFGLTAEGPRFTLDADYEMQILRFDDNDDLDEVFNRLEANGSVVLLEDSAFIDAFARYDQQNIDTEGRLAYSNIFSTDNRTDYSVLGLSPYHVGRWGSRVESLVRVTAYTVDYHNTDAAALPPEESDNLDVLVTLSSPEGASGISWRAGASHTETDFDGGEDFEFDQARFEVGVPVGGRTRLLATIGSESDVEEDTTGGGLDETLWLLGFRWEPSNLQSIEIRGGDRFYGSAWEAEWRRRGSRGELGVDYEENPTTSTGVLGNDDLFVSGFPRFDVGSLDTRPFLQKRLSGRAAYDLPRSRVAARVYSDRREYLDVSGGDEDSLGMTVSFDWDAAARTTVGIVASLEQREFESGRDDDYIDINFRVQRQITRVLSGELRFTHIERDSDDSSEDYDANLVSLFLVARFGEGEEDAR